ncbi:MAG: deoxyribodipyrimidine photo-lyase [Sphingomonadales bacterium]|nr:deoxyribodipyrimidine photo-lyase [Sphingomonadales bacterium]
MKPAVSVFWFRRDLRLQDNAGLFRALKGEHPVLPVFIFDKAILDELEDPADARVNFIHHSLEAIQQQLIAVGSTLYVQHGSVQEVFSKLCDTYAIQTVYTNTDYEPYARARDNAMADFFTSRSIAFVSVKDQVIFERSEIVKDDGLPYTVFTPYSRKWRATIKAEQLRSWGSEKLIELCYKQEPIAIPSLKKIGFRSSGQRFPDKHWDKHTIKRYKEQRDFPAVSGTSRLSVHLRFGTISIRALAREAGALNESFLSELIWRDFYQMIIWHFPHVVSSSFKPAYDKIEWRNNEKEFEAWCQGRTGYPIVDAGMRELNQTGFMHNRVRMIVASFLTKHLLIDWRWGEAYFAKKLLDFDLSANNGGWQWAAGSGCDAAPYFRVFNPYIQTKKFDPDLRYIQQWVPESQSLDYPAPIVQHEAARARCLAVYAKALKG